MTAGIQLLGGIQFSGGSTILGDDASPNISITPWDITNRGSSGSGVTYVGNPPTLDSWTVDPGTVIASSIYFEATNAGTLADWYAKFSNAGFDPDYSYAWNATWATGGSTVVRMAIGSNGTYTGDPNLMKIIPIDTTIPGWEVADPFTTLAKPGTYNLPVALTPYIPTTQMTYNWY
jgi:hypothetical protein